MNPTRTRAVRVPDPRPVVHPLRGVGSATWSIAELPHGRRRVTIDHAPLPGVTPADLLWWFTHIGGTVRYGGAVVPRYLAWHPVDHILWELARPASDGSAGEGARFRIVERFARNPAIDVTERVEKLDATGIRLVQRRFGVKIFQLEHTWSAAAEGAHYVSVMDIGARHSWLAPLNRWLTTRAMPVALCEAWVQHNVEEVGQLPFLLAALTDQLAVAR
ncbi:hypothetical protein [Kineosporia sp. A_224]|uniref:hypothetical protein n=1 Tax=Kineosporia sp. A_224 TaxID=1962180 RepID=UPI000B4AA13C